MDLVGGFSGDLKVRINKRDFDFTVTLYELMADGRRMQLSYCWAGPATYAIRPRASCFSQANGPTCPSIGRAWSPAAWLPAAACWSRWTY